MRVNMFTPTTVSINDVGDLAQGGAESAVTSKREKVSLDTIYKAQLGQISDEGFDSSVAYSGQIFKSTRSKNGNPSEMVEEYTMIRT